MKILYLTDLYYSAKGREYFKEDLYLSSKLKDYFDLVLCHPQNSQNFEEDVDLIIFRNTGSVLGFKEIYDSFRKRVNDNNLRVFNEFKGKADMSGKQYLIDLFSMDYPVIPTVDDLNDINLLPVVKEYVIKPKNGADSIGLKFLTRDELFEQNLENHLIQPKVDFKYEVSFYFINDKLEYAMYAPDKNKRWELKKYDYSQEDLEFAKKFIEWNDIEKGIQRVDACRTNDGKLLLVELEDLNPYLSLLELDEYTRDNFVNDLIKVINKLK